MSTNGATDLVSSPIRMYDVDGFQERKNDVVYAPTLVPQEDASVLVFFPGDVQDYSENMEVHRDNKNYKQWNLESTAANLQRQFKSCHVLVIKPSRMGFKTFSCFQNFVESNQLGVPEHTSNHNALLHLDYLLKNVSKRLEKCNLSQKNSITEAESVSLGNSANLENSKYKLIGFSKGCVVLNQLLHEFHFNMTEKNQDIQKIILKIKDMYWLDGGHSGGKNTWVTDKNILQSLTSLDINIHVHVTPYQIQDERRPWIKVEEKAFSETLKKLNCNIIRTVHFEGVPPSIIKHFDVLNAFRQ